MADIGDWVSPRLTVSPADATTVAALTITTPAGVTTAGTGEVTADAGATWTADAVQLTAAGVWVLNWTVTGTGKSAERQRVIVLPAATPGPVPDPPALATITDLTETLGRDLTATEALRAPRLLASASTKVRSYCKQTFAAAEDDEIVLRPVGTTLRLPSRPVTAVTQVEQIGTGGTADRVMGVTEWHFDGIDQIELWPDPTCVTGVAPTGSYANTYRVTYDHNGATAFIVDMVVAVTLRTLLAPTLVAGLVSEHVGKYGYQYGQASGDQSPGATVKLTKDDKKELVEAGYRRTAGTIQTRVG